jgi:hypothetical protein
MWYRLLAMLIPLKTRGGLGMVAVPVEETFTGAVRSPAELVR